MSSHSSCRSRFTSGKSWTASGPAVVPGAVPDALGDLGHRHAPGGEVLHQGWVDSRLAGQAVDALGAAAVQPALDVLDDHARVAPGTLEADRSRRDLDLDRVVGGIGHRRGRLPPGAVHALEGLGRRLHVEDVGHPGADESLLRLPFLVLADGLGGHAIDLGIGVGQGGGHASDGDGAALQADGDQAAEDVGEERRGLDVHPEAVGPDRLRVVMTNSKMLALRSQRAAFRPAAYGPSS